MKYVNFKNQRKQETVSKGTVPQFVFSDELQSSPLTQSPKNRVSQGRIPGSLGSLTCSVYVLRLLGIRKYANRAHEQNQKYEYKEQNGAIIAAKAAEETSSVCHSKHLLM